MSKTEHSIVLQRAIADVYDSPGSDHSAVCRDQIRSVFHRRGRYIRITVGTRPSAGTQPIRIWTETERIFYSDPSSVRVRWDISSRRKRLTHALYPFATGWLLERFELSEKTRILHVKIEQATEDDFRKAGGQDESD